MPEIPSGLPSLGQATLVLLRQWGVSSAEDVILRGISGYDGLPGLGPAKWAVLLDWAMTNADFEERMRLMNNRAGIMSISSLNYEVRIGHKLGRDWYASAPKLTDDQRARLSARFDAIEAENEEQRARLSAEVEAANQRQMYLYLGIFLTLALGFITYFALK